MLDEVFDAHGGVDRWRGLQRFTVHFSMNGRFLSSKSQVGVLKDLVAEGSTRFPWLRLTGFPAPDQCGVYGPDRAAIETLNGTLLAVRDHPRTAFREISSDAAWDNLHLVCYCGILIWNCLAAPFLLADPSVEVMDLGTWRERDETWRCVRAIFPGSANTLAPEQVFYFDQHGLQRRTDHVAIDTPDIKVAQYSWAHQTFSGIAIPTLHRGLILRPDGTIVRKPPRQDIEIFDVQFE